MLDLIFSPLKAINRAKRKSMKRTTLILLVASLLSFVNFFLVSKSFSGTIFLGAIAALVGTFLGTLVMAWLLNLVLHILTAKGEYYHAFTTLTYGLFIGMVFFLLWGIINLIPSSGLVLTVIVSILGGIAMLLGVLLSYAVMFKTAMELYDTDILTVFVGLGIVYMAIFASVYMVILKTIFASLGSMGGIPMTGLL